MNESYTWWMVLKEWKATLNESPSIMKVDMAPPEFTKYYTANIYKHPDLNPDLLELSSQSPADLEKANQAIDAFAKTHPQEVTDRDQDGSREIPLQRLPEFLKENPTYGKSSPFATYFADPQRAKKLDRLEGLPRELKQATKTHDFKAARDYFRKIAQEASKNPLMALAKPLAQHLHATAIHAGVPIEYNSTDLESSSGFSKTREERLRFNCTTFTLLAHSDLKGIAGLDFQFITLTESTGDPSNPVMTATAASPVVDFHRSFSGSDIFNPFQHSSSAHRIQLPSVKPKQFDFGKERTKNADRTGAHQVLLISDNQGRHLLVDNTRVVILPKNQDPYKAIREMYSGQYSYFYRSGKFSEPGVSF